MSGLRSDEVTEADGPDDGAAVACLSRAADERLWPGDALGDFIVIRPPRGRRVGLCVRGRAGRRAEPPGDPEAAAGGGAGEREQFLREGELQAGAGLHHQGILPVYAAGQDGDRSFLVLPFVRGASCWELIRAVRGALGGNAAVDPAALVRTLADDKDRDFARPRLVHDDRRPPAAEGAAPPPGATLRAGYFRWVAGRMAEVGRAVDAAHRAGVLHLDLTPANILIESGTDQVRVCDFGVGTRIERDEADGAERSTACPRAWTQEYTAPEVPAGRADVYGLGAVLWELLTLGKCAEPPTVVPPPDLLAIAARATAADPADRYPTAAALADDLQRYLDHRPTDAGWGWRAVPRAFGMWFRRNLRWTAPGAAALAGLAALAVGVVVAVRAEAAREKDRLTAAWVAAEGERTLVDAQAAIRDAPPRAGWSRDVPDRFRAVLRLRPDADLRDLVAPTLGGMDADLVYHHTVLGPDAGPAEVGFGQVAFDPTGERLVAAAWWEPGRKPGAAVVWDGNAANRPVPGARPGHGPVAFPAADAPLQLLLAGGPQPEVPLWNVATGATVLTLPLPGPRHVVAAALSADARFAAAALTADPDGDPGATVTRLWALDRRAGTARQVAEWPGGVETLAFSPRTAGCWHPGLPPGRSSSTRPRTASRW